MFIVIIITIIECTPWGSFKYRKLHNKSYIADNNENIVNTKLSSYYAIDASIILQFSLCMYETFVPKKINLFFYFETHRRKANIS